MGICTKVAYCAYRLTVERREGFDDVPKSIFDRSIPKQCIVQCGGHTNLQKAYCGGRLGAWELSVMADNPGFE